MERTKSCLTVALFIFHIGYSASHAGASKGKPGNVISIPLLDNLKASLVADLDVTELNSILHDYINTEIQKGLETVYDIVNITTEQLIRDMLVNKGVMTSTYVRWGRKSCDGGPSSMLYTGYMAGPNHKQKSGGTNYLCLTSDPETRIFPSDWSSNNPGRLYGIGYEMVGVDKSKNPEHSDDKDVPCTVCLTEKSTVMIPGRKSCYPGWSLVYDGFLASPQSYSDRIPAEYVCIDGDLEWYGTTNYNQGIITYVVAKCGSIPCDKYPDNTKLSCVVCSR